MATHRVLVAFASEQGSTAAIARDIARALRERGLEVDCLPATSVRDVTPYEGVILGSGVFLPRRASDGQGFLPRHAAALRSRPVWLFAAGPLGRTAPAADTATVAAGGEPDSPLARVARTIGARGLAAFGVTAEEAIGPAPGTSARQERERVRGWAETIAAAFRDSAEPTRPH